jgi:integrase
MAPCRPRWPDRVLGGYPRPFLVPNAPLEVWPLPIRGSRLRARALLDTSSAPLLEAIARGVGPARDPLPERDLAVSARTRLTGLRVSEPLDLDVDSIDGRVTAILWQRGCHHTGCE